MILQIQISNRTQKNSKVNTCKF